MTVFAPKYRLTPEHIFPAGAYSSRERRSGDSLWLI